MLWLRQLLHVLRRRRGTAPEPGPIVGQPICLFIDTNLLLHGRDLKGLPWSEIRADADFRLVVARTVASEIDKLKADGNSRRARRARKISSLLGEALSACGEIVLRESGPHVALALAPPGPIEWARFPSLDRERADDRLVAEALIQAARNGEVIVVSNDVGPRHTAMHHGLACFAVPDHWLLEPEPDERDRRIQELQAQVRALSSTKPAMTAEFVDAESAPITELHIDAIDLPDLTSAEVNRLAEEIERMDPPGSFDAPSVTAAKFPELVRHLSVMDTVMRPSKEQIERYLKIDYPQFRKEVREYFGKLVFHLKFRERQRAFGVLLKNSGYAPAENLCVEIQAAGQMGLLAEAIDIGEFPKPPQRPRSLWEGTGMAGGSFGGSLIDLVRPREIDLPGRRETYWTSKPTIKAASGTLFCAEFRHRTEHRQDLVVFAHPHFASGGGAITVAVSASNLPEPVIATLPIKFSTVPADTLNVAAAAGLPEEVLLALQVVGQQGRR